MQGYQDEELNWFPECHFIWSREYSSFSCKECAFNICHWTSQSQSRNQSINMKYEMKISINQTINISFNQANVPRQSIEKRMRNFNQSINLHTNHLDQLIYIKIDVFMLSRYSINQSIN